MGNVQSNFKGHITQLCLPIPLHLGSLKFQYENSYGKTFANMLIFVEGMKSLDLISEADYEYYKDRYNKPLVDKRTLTPEQFRKEQTREAYCREQNRLFGNVLDEYVYLRNNKPESLKAFLKKAKLPENKNIKNCKLLLERARQDVERVLGDS